jgi:hypothetical protein
MSYETDNITNEEVLEAARKGRLPDDFDFVAFKDCKGIQGDTPAHIAALNGRLPANFDFMAFKDYKNDEGFTPAKIAEQHNNLPVQFKDAREAEAFDYSLEEAFGPGM